MTAHHSILGKRPMKRNWQHAALCMSFSLIASKVVWATPPGRETRVRLERFELRLHDASAVLGWFQTHGYEVEQALSSHRKRAFYTNKKLLFQYARVKRSPQGTQEPVIVAVPMVDQGTTWTVKDQRVIIGYQRPSSHVIEDTHREEELIGGKRVVRTETQSKSIERTARRMVNELHEPGDTPVLAETLQFAVDWDGKVYVLTQSPGDVVFETGR